MKLILVRHGQQSDIAGENFLTIKGVKQAIEAAAKLAETKIDTMYCSPSKRCEQTMDEILRIRSDNFPIHFSNLIGPKLASESFEKFKSRVELFLDDLKYDQEKDDIVVIVSHQFVIAMIALIVTGEKKEIENGELFEIVLEFFATGGVS